jgi:hypothetical protein
MDLALGWQLIERRCGPIPEKARMVENDGMPAFLQHYTIDEVMQELA